MKRFALFFVLGWSLSLFAQENCLRGIPSNVTARYRAPEGVGYSEGYGTLAGFLTPNWQRDFQPFLDVRGHMFNNGRTATNIGIGSRCAVGEWAFGANFYYDFRDAKRLRAHQLGPGIEILNPYVDFRVNGYIPVDNDVNVTSPAFSRFQGNSIFISQKGTAALPNVGAEFGIPIPGLVVDPYFSVGPYYLFKKHLLGTRCGGTWGGIARLGILIFDGISIGGEVSYDKEYKTRANGYASINFPLGPNTIRTGGRRWNQWYSPNCNAAAKMQRRMTQPVIRQEIIPICDASRESQLDSSLFNCIFVDNTAPVGGNGSFEAPFQVIQDAVDVSSPGDCIYVFGRGTEYLGPAPLVTVPHSLFFLGSGISHQLGTFTLPPQTTQFPELNVPGPFGNIFTWFAASGTISINGFSFLGGDPGIVASAIGDTVDFLFLNNRVDVPSTISAGYINLFALHNVRIENNVFNVSSPALITANTSNLITISNNVINDNDATGLNASIELNSSSSSVGIIRNNTISAPSSRGIRIRVPGGTMENNVFSIDSNTVTSGLAGIELDTVGGFSETTISNNMVTTTGAPNAILANFRSIFPPFSGFVSIVDNTASTGAVRVETIPSGVDFACLELLRNTASSFSLEDIDVTDTLATTTSSNTGPIVTAGTVTFGTGCAP